MARRIAAVLALDGVQQVVSGFQRAGAGAKQFAGETASAMGKADAAWSKHQSQVDKIGSASSKAFLGGTAALTGITRATMGWESAWAGVTKTVDGSPQQMAALESGLRGLAKALPQTHEEIAKVAENAGQLGIQRQNILGFTKTMVDLGETTNLSADEASTSIAQMMNVMGTSQSDVGRLASTLVALGNAGASTEKDIMETGMRISAAGKMIGMSETQVLSYANAMSSLGIEAEAGGTAMSMTFKQIDAAVREGGTGLQTIAQTAGMSADAFKKAWGHDAAGATASFIEGLGRVTKSGGDANAILSSLGMTGVRQTDTLLRLSSATKAAGASQNLLRDSLATGAQAWQQNTALSNEASKRYATSAARAKIAWNQIKDSAITAGQAMLPVVAQIATVVEGLTRSFDGLPNGVKTSAVAMLAIGTAGAGAVSAITKIGSAASSAKGVIEGLGISMKTASLAGGAIGIALTVAAVALGKWIQSQAESKARTDQFTQAIQQQGTAVGEATRQIAAQQLQQAGAFDAANRLGVSLKDVTEASLGSADAAARMQAQLAKIDMTKLSIDDVTRVQDDMDKLNQAVGRTGKEFGDAAAKQQQMAAATGQSADASKQDAAAKDQQKQKLQEAAQASKEMLDASQALGNALLALSGSQIGFESAIDAATKSLHDNGRTLDINTEKGRANQQALNQMASGGMQYIKTLQEQGASSQSIAAAQSRLQSQFVKTATAMGMPAAKAKALAAAFTQVPAKVETKIKADASQAKNDLAVFNAELKTVPPQVQTHLKQVLHRQGLDAAKQALATYKDKQIILKAVGKDVGAHATAQMVTMSNGKVITLVAKGNPAGAKSTQAFVRGADGKIITLTATGNPTGAKNAIAVVKGADGKTIYLHANGDSSGAQAALNVMRAAQSKTVYLTTVYRQVGSAMAHAAAMPGRAAGGPVFGPGTETSDDIPTLLSNNEHVLTAAEVRAYGGHDAVLRLRRAMLQGAVPRFATGGHIGSPGNPYTGKTTYITPATTDFTQMIRAMASLEAAVRHSSSVQRSTAAVMVPLARANSRLTAARDAKSALAAQHRVEDAEYAVRIANAKSKVRTVRVGGYAGKKGVDTSAQQGALRDRARQADLDYRQRILNAENAHDKKRVARLQAERKQANLDFDRKLAALKAQETPGTKGSKGKLVRVGGENVERLRREKQRNDLRQAKEMAAATARVTAATHAHAAAAAKAKKAQEAQAKASELLKQRQQALAEAQKKVADNARQVSDAMSGKYGMGWDLHDWAATMQQGTADLTKLARQLQQLRRMGLRESLVQQIASAGPEQGSIMASQVISGGKSSIDHLNHAALELQKAADRLGKTQAVGMAYGGITREAQVSSKAITWAEAGPEAYIPLDGSLRSRMLLGRVANDFGMQLSPSQAQRSVASGGRSLHYAPQVQVSGTDTRDVVARLETAMSHQYRAMAVQIPGG